MDSLASQFALGILCLFLLPCSTIIARPPCSPGFYVGPGNLNSGPFSCGHELWRQPCLCFWTLGFLLSNRKEVSFVFEGYNSGGGCRKQHTTGARPTLVLRTQEVLLYYSLNKHSKVFSKPGAEQAAGSRGMNETLFCLFHSFAVPSGSQLEITVTM